MPRPEETGVVQTAVHSMRMDAEWEQLEVEIIDTVSSVSNIGFTDKASRLSSQCQIAPRSLAVRISIGMSWAATWTGRLPRATAKSSSTSLSVALGPKVFSINSPFESLILIEMIRTGCTWRRAPWARAA